MARRVFVLHPWFKQQKFSQSRTPESCLEEAAGLAHAIDLEVVQTAIVALAQATPSTLIGKGKIEELNGYIAECEAELVIINHALSPVQQRNLEKAWNCKVIDRTALILEIFGARARTHEGKLQVELAALEYQKSRLVRSWTHLERQRGGFGFLGGPGESQIEIDRRLIRDRIAKIKNQLGQVVRTRELHRKTRRDTPYPVVALVGYTNAGKSTLFNKLTGANVMAQDKLFATLDPTMRLLALPSGAKVILSDTVGFISDLPTQLVAAFRATLEEVLEADLLLHVRDISHPDSEAQKRDVEQVLIELFGEGKLPEHMLELHNKMDLLKPPIREGDGREEDKTAQLINTPPHGGRKNISVSALTGEGLEALLQRMDNEMAGRFYRPLRLRLQPTDGKALAWLHAHGKVVEQIADDAYIDVVVQISQENANRFKRLFHTD